MADPIVHFEVGITDGARARDFYGELFGWRFQTEPDESNTLVVFEEGIGGNLMQVPEGASPYVTFYVLVDCASSPDSGHMCRSIVDTDDGGLRWIWLATW